MTRTVAPAVPVVLDEAEFKIHPTIHLVDLARVTTMATPAGLAELQLDVTLSMAWAVAERVTKSDGMHKFLTSK